MISARRWKSGCLIANINADEKYRHIKKIHIFHFLHWDVYYVFLVVVLVVFFFEDFLFFFNLMICIFFPPYYQTHF